MGDNMNNELKKRFPLFLNQESLRSAIETVCAPFGKVTYLEILPPAREPGLQTLQCICLLRLDSAAGEVALASKLEVVEFGRYLVFFADVDERWTDTTIQ
jgi:hypothetical protein